MRHLTLCLAYYDNPSMLALQLERMAALPEPLRDHLHVIVVDDASPRWPVRCAPGAPGLDVRLYRMREDKPWNQDACRNLAVDRADTEWVLLTDMDHVASPLLVKAAIEAPLDGASAYTFARVSAPEFEPYKPHPNSWLMTKGLYDTAGGYDERYAGVYGTDGMFKGRVAAAAREVVARTEFLIRYPREVVADASTTTLERKGEANEARRAKVRAAIEASGDRWPVRGLNAWDRVWGC